MIIQAFDKRGNFLYKWSIEIERKDSVSLYRKGFLVRKKPIKRPHLVLDNLIKKQGLFWEYTSASLRPYEQYEQESDLVKRYKLGHLLVFIQMFFTFT